jgi:hypothetical protein
MVPATGSIASSPEFCSAGLSCRSICTKTMVSSITQGIRQKLWSDEILSPSRKPLEKFWYNGACCEPGCTSFPSPPNFWEHNSEKCGTGAELLNNHRRERTRSYIAGLRRLKCQGHVVQYTAGVKHRKNAYRPPETPWKNLVQRGLLRARLYLVSLISIF